MLTIFSGAARIGRAFSPNHEMWRGTGERGEKKKETTTHAALWVGPKRDADWFIAILDVAALVLRNFDGFLWTIVFVHAFLLLARIHEKIKKLKSNLNDFVTQASARQ